MWLKLSAEESTEGVLIYRESRESDLSLCPKTLIKFNTWWLVGSQNLLLFFTDLDPAELHLFKRGLPGHTHLHEKAGFLRSHFKSVLVFSAVFSCVWYQKHGPLRLKNGWEWCFCLFIIFVFIFMSRGKSLSIIQTRELACPSRKSL